MRVILIIFLLSLSCCTTTSNLIFEQYTYDYIDSTISPILDMFEYEAKIRGHIVDRTNLSVTFGMLRKDKDDRTVGYCVRSAVGGMVIKIYKPTWDKMDDWGREELIFHELGHCLIGREHCGKENKNGPVSIMYPRVLDSNYYRNNREDLVNELFNISSECIGDNGHINEVDGPLCPQKNPFSKGQGRI